MIGKLLSSVLLALGCTIGAAFAQVTIDVQYSNAYIFKNAHEAIAKRFMELNPDIRINFRAPQKDYNEAALALAREVTVNQAPDVSFQGFNMLRSLAERNLLVKLDPFLKQMGDPGAYGWDDSVLSLGRVNGEQYGVGFAASIPIGFYNADLVRKAGGDPDRMPEDWDGYIALSKKIGELGPNIHGMYYRWSLDDWMFQALVFSHGGEMVSRDSKSVGFDNDIGRNAVAMYRRFVTETGMPTMTNDASRQSFFAGQMGFQFASTSLTDGFKRSVGDRFELRVAPFPIADKAKGRIPTGGAAAVMTTKDPAKQAAAWKYLMFVASPEGTSIMTRNTGYMPTNVKAMEDPALKAFYAENPLFSAANRDIGRKREWAAYPGARSGQMVASTIDILERVVKGETPAADGFKELVRTLNGFFPK